MIASTLPPALRPDDASYMLVCTMNSWRESVAGTAMFGVELVPIEFASMPLMRTLLLVVRWPFTEMIASPRPSLALLPKALSRPRLLPVLPRRVPAKTS